MRKLNWKKIIIRTCWSLLGVGVVVIFGAAMVNKSKQSCQGIRVTIESVASDQLFIDEKEISGLLDSTFQTTGKAIHTLPLRSMELLLERNPWIADAEIYLDNNRIIHAVIRERLPIARIFTMQEHSFYIDSAGVHLPLSDKMATRVPVFTDFPSDQPVLAKPDSLLFADIIAISKYIAADSFWMAQVSQIAILPGNQFEMYLLTGTPTILLGDASDLTEKFHKLDAYFRSDYFKMGYGKYGKLSAQYRRQLIGIRADSLRQRASIDSAGFYRALQGIEQVVAQQTMAGKNLSELPVATTAAAIANSLTKTLISSDKNIEKSYNKSRDSALSNKAQLRSDKTGRQGSAKINPPQQKNKK